MTGQWLRERRNRCLKPCPPGSISLPPWVERSADHPADRSSPACFSLTSNASWPPRDISSHCTTAASPLVVFNSRCLSVPGPSALCNLEFAPPAWHKQSISVPKYCCFTNISNQTNRTWNSPLCWQSSLRKGRLTFYEMPQNCIK